MGCSRCQVYATGNPYLPTRNHRNYGTFEANRLGTVYDDDHDDDRIYEEEELDVENDDESGTSDNSVLVEVPSLSSAEQKST